MKANKQGISLIVLIITIVVIIILAAAIILNLSNTNIIDNAHKAVSANDLAEIQSAVNLKMSDIFVETKGVKPSVDEVLEGYPADKEEKIITGINKDLEKQKIVLKNATAKPLKKGDLVVSADYVVSIQESDVEASPATPGE